jgi:hypothetical protein
MRFLRSLFMRNVSDERHTHRRTRGWSFGQSDVRIKRLHNPSQVKG